MSTMTATTAAIQAAADALRAARETRTPIGRISESHGIDGIDAAYEVAEINAVARTKAGARVIGKKIGLTSKAVQQQLGVDQPDFGVLFDDMEVLDGDEIPSHRLIQPKVEAEIAFVVGRDLRTLRPSYGEFLAALAYAVPAIEIVDSAIKDWKITLVDTVADNASSALFVLGNQPRSLDRFELGEVGLQMDINGKTASVGGGAACLGHPLRASYWLARVMAERGEGLRAGEVILSGALGPMVAVKPSDLIHARIGALGGVSCRFA